MSPGATAVEGDTVDISDKGITVNGKLLRNSSPRPFNRQNHPLPHWSFGACRVASGTVWVVSSFNPRSFDSRYLDPIRMPSVRARLRVLITE
jgi:type IV secretory pathway protease TraF